MSTDDGTIWAFAGPMLIIIMVNKSAAHMIYELCTDKYH